MLVCTGITLFCVAMKSVYHLQTCGNMRFRLNISTYALCSLFAATLGFMLAQHREENVACWIQLRYHSYELE